ncbi:carbohydrate binding family 9 domain-containing protein [Gammaproteobacteria bacterium]|nr:carbohydrate binding family 9 domain-containing protein [Gammaproteobacteria bacterium]MDA8799226.1 carbohydrate binding family 9 domain-containing protein [Gammaproteobacteria bacterium]MDC0906716.1 carbohydrate binding family 9 domain-containing protein [Gammaproteobacteria bacterium]MDC1042917.1 carbohydrate binding family 9 domain-containing protein [Gammaproteobacteria bacterium]
MLKKLPSILKTSIMTPVTYVLIASCLLVPDIMGNNIMLDGTLSPEEWNQASSYDLEYEVMPSRNTPAALKTTAYMKYDKKYLYIGIKAFGDPNKIRATLKNRDQTWNEDYVAMMADPFRDGRYGVLIGVNALGVQLDEKHISSAGPDDSWNILFQSATAFQDDGYSAEFMIPFSELQLPDTEIQQWKIGFIRKSYQAGVQTVFASFKNLPAETCYACQADEEVLLGSPDEIYRSYLYPYIFINQFGNRPVKKFKVQNPDYEIGITGLYDLTRSSSIEYTINPDFSQIESDAPVIMENQTFALSYPEKRTFFLEGSELLKSDTQTVYTRSITNPLGAIKYTNQGENNSIYFLQATDTDSPYLAAGQYRSFLGNAGKSKVTIGRFKKNLGNKSHIGLIATNRDYQIGGSGSVVEFDSLINFLDDYILDLNYAKSDTQEGQIDFIGSEDTFAGRTYAMDGESFSGVAKNFRLRRAVDQSNWGVRFKDVSPTYRAHVGFVGRNDYKSRNYWYGRTYRSTGTIRRINFNWNNRNRLNYRNQKTQEFYQFRVELETDFNFTGQIEWQVKASEKFDDIQYGKQTEFEIRGQYHPSESFFTSFEIEKGDSIAYRIDNPEIGDATEYNLYNVFRFSDNFKIALGHRYSELKNKVTGEEFYAGEINRFEIDYQIDGALSTRTIIEKNDFSEDYFLEALIQWKPNPYTIFYAGGTQFYKEPNPFSDNIRLETSQIYAKFQYFYNPNS